MQMDYCLDNTSSEMDFIFFFGGFSSSGQSDALLLGSSIWHITFLLLASHDFSPVFGGLPPNIVLGGQLVGFRVAKAGVA